jgi:hypothetical protein
MFRNDSGNKESRGNAVDTAGELRSISFLDVLLSGAGAALLGNAAEYGGEKCALL